MCLKIMFQPWKFYNSSVWRSSTSQHHETATFSPLCSTARQCWKRFKSSSTKITWYLWCQDCLCVTSCLFGWGYDGVIMSFIRDIGPAVRVFANGPGDLGSIPGRVIPKTLKMVLDTTLLNTQHYKVRFKGKVEQSWEWSSALPYTLV